MTIDEIVHHKRGYDSGYRKALNEVRDIISEVRRYAPPRSQRDIDKIEIKIIEMLDKE